MKNDKDDVEDENNPFCSKKERNLEEEATKYHISNWPNLISKNQFQSKESEKHTIVFFLFSRI